MDGWIQVIAILAVLGFALYALNSWVTMDPKFKTVINFVVGLGLVLWVLSLVLGGGLNFPHGR